MIDPFLLALNKKSLSSSFEIPSSDFTTIGSGSTPVQNTWDTRRAITSGYNISSWVNWSVTGHMRAISGISWFLTEKNSQNEWHPTSKYQLLENLIDIPGKRDTFNKLMQMTVSHLYLGGNGIWKLILGTMPQNKKYPLGKIPTQVRTMYPWKIRVVPDPDDETRILGYKYGIGFSGKIYDPAEIFHPMFINPEDARWGQGRLQAAARVIDMDLASISWQLGSMNRRGVPSGIITFENPINQIQHKQAVDWVNERLEGPDNAHRTLILGNKARYKEMERTSVEMDFLKSRGFTRDEVVILFGYHPSQTSSDASTFNNMDLADKHVWNNERIPFLNGIMGELNATFLPYFTEDPASVSFQYDLSNVASLRSDVSEKSKTYTILTNNRVPPRDAARVVGLDLEPFDGDDASMVTKNMVLTATVLRSGQQATAVPSTAAGAPPAATVADPTAPGVGDGGQDAAQRAG